MKFIRVLVIAMLGCLYAALFAEFFIRFLEPQPLMPRFVTGAPWGVRDNIAGAVYRQQTPEVDVTIRINSQGMRADREYTQEKPPDICRIALFGDSYFMGYEVNLQDSLAYQIKKLMKEANFEIEVLNFSVSGFGTAEMIRHYEAKGVQFQSDIVVFQWHASDPEDNLRSGLFTLDENGRLLETGQNYLPGIAVRDALMKFKSYRWLIENSHFYSAIRERLALTVKQLLAKLKNLQFATQSEAKPSEVGSATPDYAQRLSSKLLDHALKITGENQSAWLLFDIPIFSSRTKFISSFDEIDFSAEVQQQTLSPLPAFQVAADPDLKLYFERGHRHLTPVGNRLAAGVLVKAFMSEKYAPYLRHCNTQSGSKSK